MIEEAGLIERFLLEGDPGNTPDVGPAIESFSRRALEFDFRPVYPRLPERPGVAYFFPRPSGGGACKRLNLYVRWMVRHDEVDLGVWPSVSRARLVVPLDTHVIRVGRCLGLTARRTPGWRMAAEITGALRALDPDDPVRYDFALCHVGMHGLCGHDRPQGDERCPLKGLCSPHAAAARAEPGGQAGAARRASSSARR